jgi:hypothetical protein
MQNNKGGIAMREMKTCPDQEWKQLPTEELDHILQAELEKECPDEEVVLPILRILEDREKDYSVEQTPEVLAMLGKLSEHKISSKQSKSKRRWITGFAAVAAAACVVIMALPQTVGAESIFDVLFRWTSSVFEFFTPEQDASNPPVDIVFETDHPSLQQLYDQVTQLGVTENVVPMWLPEGFKLIELKATPLSDDSGKINAVFSCDSNNIIIAYRVPKNVFAKYEKKDAALDVYDYAGVSHFILENMDKVSVTWTVNNVECSIVAEIPKDDVYQIIKSIYRRGLH